MRILVWSLCFVLLIPAVPAHAGDGPPTPDELARMILDGSPGELLLVEAWLEKSERAELVAVFEALRRVRKLRAAASKPGPEIDLTETGPDKPEFPTPAGDKHKLVNAEVRVIDIARAAAPKLLGQQRPTEKRRAVQLTKEQAARLLKAVGENQDAQIVSAPRITVYDGQKANVSVLNQVSYIQDYDVEVTKDGKSVADPVVGVLQEGTVIDLKPTCAADGKVIDFDFTGTFAAIQRPIPEFETKLDGTDQKVTIQLPEMRVTRVDVKVHLPDGGWVLIGGGVTLEPKKGKTVERVALVHMRSLEVGPAFLEDIAREPKGR